MSGAALVVDDVYTKWNERSRDGAMSWSFATLDAFRAGVCWAAGCAANYDGQFNTQCPYEDDEQFSQWQAGWNDTEAHRIEQEEDRRREVNFHGYA